MNEKRNRIFALMVVLAVATGGLLVLSARSAPKDAGPQGLESKASSIFMKDPNFPASAPAGLGSKELFLKMMLSILVVVVLAVAAVYVSKKLLPKVTNLPGKEIRVLETAYLGPRKAIHLVEVSGQKLLIGSTNESLTTLAHMTDAWPDLSKQQTET